LSRIAYYTINILGLTFLPLLVRSQHGRMMGLVAISFLANAINALFTSGYSAWHMGYIEPEVRSGYMTATTLVSSTISGILLLLLGAITDDIEGQSRQVLLAGFRCAAFLAAILDVYFLQKPKEPEYKTSSQTRIFLFSTLKIPLSNKRFMLIMAVYLLHASFACMVNSVVNSWLLEEIKVSYAYISFINLTNVFFIIPTSAYWGKSVRKRGTLGTLALAQTLMAPSYFLHALMSESNYLWVMTAVKLIQNCVNMGTIIAVNSLIYIALPEENQTSYLSFYQILTNLAALLGMSFSTWVVAQMGDNYISIAGFRFTSVPVLFLIQAAAFTVLPFLVRRVGRIVEPEGWKINKQQYHHSFLHKGTGGNG
ncbi:MAG: MFS transporter, partial [Gemmiger sp.]